MKVGLPYGSKVVIKDHALMRYLTRAEIMDESEFNELLMNQKNGDKKSGQILTRYRNELKHKFRKTYLHSLNKDGMEKRRENSGSLNKRCTFVAVKKGLTFIVISVALQGKQDDFWKIGNSPYLSSNRK